MRLIDANELKGSVVKEQNLVMKRLMSHIDRAEKVDAIPVKWILSYAGKYFTPGEEENISRMIDTWKKEQV